MRQLTTWGVLACLTGWLPVPMLAISAEIQSPSKTKSQPKAKTSTQQSNPSPGKSNGSSSRKQRPTLSKKQHATVMKFARAHHSELADLLLQLKQRNTSDYKQAAIELHTDVERLERLRQRSPDRHKLELDLWKLDSHVKLLAARLTMSQRPEVEAELRAALLKRVNLRLVRLRAEHQRMKTRLDRLDVAIDQLASDPEQAADVDWKKLQVSLNKNKTRKAKRRTTDAQRPTTAKNNSPGP